MSEEAAFLEALKANPADDTTRLVYADWLDEHGEHAKAVYLRLVVSAVPTLSSGAPAVTVVDSVAAMLKSLPLDWRLSVASRFGFVLTMGGPGGKVEAIKLVRELAGMGLGAAKHFVESPPQRLPLRTTLESAVGLQRYFGGNIIAVPPGGQSDVCTSMTFSAFAYLYPQGWYGEDEWVPSDDALTAYREFLIATGIPATRAEELAGERGEVELASGLELLEFEPRYNAWRSFLPPPDPTRGWDIALHTNCFWNPPLSHE